MVIERASLLAARCYYGRNIIYPNLLGIFEPYIMHHARVAGILMSYSHLFNENYLPHMVAAAWCHDILMNLRELSEQTSNSCGILVYEIKNIGRYELSMPAKSIQMCDMIDTIYTIINAPKYVLSSYLDQSEQFAPVLKEGGEPIHDLLLRTIAAARKLLKSF